MKITSSTLMSKKKFPVTCALFSQRCLAFATCVFIWRQADNLTRKKIHPSLHRTEGKNSPSSLCSRLTSYDDRYREKESFSKESDRRTAHRRDGEIRRKTFISVEDRFVQCRSVVSPILVGDYRTLHGNGRCLFSSISCRPLRFYSKFF